MDLIHQYKTPRQHFSPTHQAHRHEGAHLPDLHRARRGRRARRGLRGRRQERRAPPIPVGGVACIMLEPGTRVSHWAAAPAVRVGTLLVWVGEAGVGLYASGQPGGARSDHLLYQAKLALDDRARLKVVRKIYELRFGEKPPERRNLEQLRGIEGARVRKLYENLAKRHKVKWRGRRYDPTQWDASDTLNLCLSAATICLYGITEAAVLATGYAPAVDSSTPEGRCPSCTTSPIS